MLKPIRLPASWLLLGLLPGLAGCDLGLVPVSFSAEEIAAARASVKPEKAPQPLFQMVQRPMLRESTVSETAADSLARIGDQALPVLIAALSDPDPAVRSNAAKAIARLGEAAAQAVPALIAALSDSDRSVRSNAARALGQIGTAAAPAIPRLSEAMRETEPTPSATLASPAP
jgi:HEAT repeat protein